MKNILKVFLLVTLVTAIASGGSVKAYFDNPVTKDFLYLESDLLKVTIASERGNIVGWYVKALGKDIACAGYPGFAVSAQRFGGFSPEFEPYDAEGYFPGGWPTPIGTEKFETEIVLKSARSALIRQSLLVSDGLFAGLKLEKYYYFNGNSYVIDIVYVIRNMAGVVKSFWYHGKEYGIMMTVETTVNVGANYVITFQSDGTVYSFTQPWDGPGSYPSYDYLKVRKTTWAAIADVDGHYIMGSIFPPFLTTGFWPGEPRPCGVDYEVVSRPVLYHPGDVTTFFLTIYGGPGSINDIKQLALQKEAEPKPVDQFLVPSSYQLDQNYPNPFNPTTTISYTLPVDADVSLAVYDVLGQKVAQLIEGPMTAGIHHVRFDGSNLASGIYVYRLLAGDFVAAKRMIILK
jgi:hypothetical protein